MVNKNLILFIKAIIPAMTITIKGEVGQKRRKGKRHIDVITITSYFLFLSFPFITASIKLITSRTVLPIHINPLSDEKTSNIKLNINTGNITFLKRFLRL